MTIVPRWREVTQGMYGAWRFARFDRSAIAWFDRDLSTVARSFWAAAIAYPGFVLMVALMVPSESWASAGGFRILLVESIGYVVRWTAFPLVMLPFCHWLQRDEQCLGFIAAYNWAQVLLTGLGLVGLIGVTALPFAAGLGLYLLVVVAEIAYEWFIARTALDAGGVAATTVVLIDLVLSEAVSQVTQSLY